MPLNRSTRSPSSTLTVTRPSTICGRRGALEPLPEPGYLKIPEPVTQQLVRRPRERPSRPRSRSSS